MSKRKKNPLPKMLQNPLVWILGGGAVAAAGYAIYKASTPTSSATQVQIAEWQAELASLVAQGAGQSPQAVSLRQSLTAAGVTPVA